MLERRYSFQEELEYLQKFGKTKSDDRRKDVLRQQIKMCGLERSFLVKQLQGVVEKIDGLHTQKRFEEWSMANLRYAPIRDVKQEKNIFLHEVGLDTLLLQEQSLSEVLGRTVEKRTLSISGHVV